MLTALAIATEAASKVIETMSPSLHPRMDDEPPQRALLPSHGSCAPSQLALKGSSQLGPSHAPYRAARKDTASEGGGGEGGISGGIGGGIGDGGKGGGDG